LVELTQPAKVKVVGTFHLPFTRRSSESWIADGTAEHGCCLCRLFLICHCQSTFVFSGAGKCFYSDEPSPVEPWLTESFRLNSGHSDMVEDFQSKTMLSKIGP
jgi:hypothetical protein